MPKNDPVLQDLIEPVVAGFWGELECLDGRIPCRVVRNGDVSKNGYIVRRELPIRFFTEYELEKARLLAGDIVLVSSGAYTGNAGLVVGADDGFPVVISNFVRRLRPKHGVEPAWLFHLIRSDAVQRTVPAHTGGSAIPNLQSSLYPKCGLPIVPGALAQRRIAEVLSTVDEAIEQTEALIAKMQKTKAGLMQDLFTRGMTADGRLRPARDVAPDLYKESPLGWIPKDWEAGHLVDRRAANRPHIKTGPFGSSLKLEHWVDHGVPVITIGALGEGEFIESQLLYVSLTTADRLHEYRLNEGDVVFSRVADVGRCAVIAASERGWIMSSNLMRISLDCGQVDPSFLQAQLAYDSRVRAQIRATVNAGGREVANSAILNRLYFSWPRFSEQELIVARLDALENQRRCAAGDLDKLRHLKAGLTHDLLSGKVTPLDNVSAEKKRAAANV